MQRLQKRTRGATRARPRTERSSMNGGGNPLTNVLGFWMTMQLVSTLALLLGGLYALFCMSRAASGLDRLASAVEDLVARGASTPNAHLPGLMPADISMPAQTIAGQATPFTPMPSGMPTPSSATTPSIATTPPAREMPFSTPPISAATISTAPSVSSPSTSSPSWAGAPSVFSTPPSVMDAPSDAVVPAASDSEKNNEYGR